MAVKVVTLHPVDKQILEILQDQGRIPNVQLAEKVGLSPPAVLERVRKLEEKGVITKYQALIDKRKVGLGTISFVSVSLKNTYPSSSGPRCFIASHMFFRQ